MVVVVVGGVLMVVADVVEVVAAGMLDVVVTGWDVAVVWPGTGADDVVGDVAGAVPFT
jgi:hypothetical protein